MLAKNSLTRLQITGQPAIVPQPQTLNEVLRLQKKQASDAVPKPLMVSHCQCFFKWFNPGLFSGLFSFFSNTIFTEKNCRRQWDSNSDRRSRRQTRWPLDHHHCPSSFQCWTSESGMKSCRHLGFSPMALFLALRGIKLHIKLKFPWN